MRKKFLDGSVNPILSPKKNIVPCCSPSVSFLAVCVTFIEAEKNKTYIRQIREEADMQLFANPSKMKNSWNRRSRNGVQWDRKGTEPVSWAF